VAIIWGILLSNPIPNNSQYYKFSKEAGGGRGGNALPPAWEG